MKKILCLYKSKYGSSKKYAEAFKQKVACDIYDIKDYKKGIEHSYQQIILFSGIYAGKITVVKELKKYYRYFSDKEIIVFVVGVSEYTSSMLEEIKVNNLNGINQEIEMFYGRGEYDESKMNVVDRVLCQMLKKSISNKDVSSLDLTMQALATITDPTDLFNLDYLNPLISYLNVKID